MHPAAWHPDPLGRHQYRYWDGEQWTEHVADDGRTAIDPIDTGSAAGAEGTSPAGSMPDTTSDPTDARAADAAGDAGQRQDTGTTSASAAAGPPDHADAARDASRATPGWSGGQYQQQGQYPSGGQWSGQYPATAPTNPTNGVAVAALVVGILSLLIAFVPVIGLVGVVGGIVALILGIIARGKVKQGEGGSGMAIAGIVTGAAAVVIAILITVALVTFGRTLVGESFQDYNACLDETGDVEFCQQQLEDELFENMRN